MNTEKKNSNPYDDEHFFAEYSKMSRSKEGLAGAGEWPTFRDLLPSLAGKSVLDLGCGYGWHCRYAEQEGATEILGIDSSEKMLARARELTAASDSKITYRQADIAQLELPHKRYDLVLSSLVLHYIEDFPAMVKKINGWLKPDGIFQFTVEHPIFTAEGHEQWVLDDNGKLKYWPVDNYFAEGERTANFLGVNMTKYHHTLTTFVDGLLQNGFVLEGLVEPMPPESMRDLPEMQPSLRMPMMLIIKARKVAQ